MNANLNNKKTSHGSSMNVLTLYIVIDFITCKPRKYFASG